MDGLLLTDVEAGDPRFDLLEFAGVPVVLAGRPAGPCPFPWVETRHDEGMAPLVDHLVGLGHERIGFLSGRAGCEHVRVRELAWRAAVSAAGLQAGPSERVIDDPRDAVLRLCAKARPRSSARATRWPSPSSRWRVSRASACPRTSR